MDISQSANPEIVRKSIGQRRHVTVLFSDVSGSSEHAERLEAEDYAELLDQFRSFARDIIPRHGGSVARLQGDGVLALFGFVESREDDGRRATLFALLRVIQITVLERIDVGHRPAARHRGDTIREQ